MATCTFFWICLMASLKAALTCSAIWARSRSSGMTTESTSCLPLMVISTLREEPVAVTPSSAFSITLACERTSLRALILLNIERLNVGT